MTSKWLMLDYVGENVFDGKCSYVKGFSKLILWYGDQDSTYIGDAHN